MSRQDWTTKPYRHLIGRRVCVFGVVTNAAAYIVEIRWFGLWRECHHFSEFPGLCRNNPSAHPDEFKPFAED